MIIRSKELQHFFSNTFSDPLYPRCKVLLNVDATTTFESNEIRLH